MRIIATVIPSPPEMEEGIRVILAPVLVLLKTVEFLRLESCIAYVKIEPTIRLEPS